MTNPTHPTDPTRAPDPIDPVDPTAPTIPSSAPARPDGDPAGARDDTVPDGTLLDPDTGAVSTPSPGRPPHLRWGLIGLVVLGGAVGTGIRASLASAFPSADGISWAVFVINVVGAFCLGLLLEALADRGADIGGRRALRLTVGTGVLGGFTTYSTLADDTARLLDVGRWGAGSGVALLTVVAGLVAVAAGTLLAAAVRPRGTVTSAESTPTPSTTPNRGASR